MANWFIILCFLLTLCACAITRSEGPPMKYCPPEDPNCHPSCIEYDANSCRYCRCKVGEFGTASKNKSDGVGNMFNTGSGMTPSSSDKPNSDWNFGEIGGDHTNEWSTSGTFSNGGGNGNSGQNNGEKIKYIIVHEKEEVPSNNIGMGSAMSPFASMKGPSPFSAGMAHSAMAMPMSLGALHGPGNVPDQLPPVPAGYHIENVLCSGTPGVPVHCVKEKLLCPTRCLTVDEYGCHSCPCAPASQQILPVLIPNERPTEAPKSKECMGTILCMLTCKDGYKLGDKNPDGCPACTCIKKVTTTPPPKKSCQDIISCVISCSVEQKGYKIGDPDSNGCPTCHCLENNTTSSHSDSSNNDHHGTTSDGSGSSNSHSSLNQQQTAMFGTGSSNNNFLSNTANGVSGGDGGCQPPMCLGGGGGGGGGGGSGNSGILGSSTSALGSMPKECKPPLSYANCPGLAGESSNSGGGSSSCVGPFCSSGSGSGGMGSGGMGSGGMGSGSSGTGNAGDSGSGSSSCTGPFCAGGSGMGGGGGMGMGGGSAVTGSTGGSGSGGSSCSGPFCSAGSGSGGGGGGGMGMGGGSASTGGMMGSPFMAAASGAGGPGIGGMSMPGSPGMGGGGAMAGGPFNSGVGPHGPMTPGSLPTNQEVAAVASNADCFGPLCSAKGGSGQHLIDDEECPELLDCMLRCDPIFDTNTNGCPRCTCPEDDLLW